MEYETPDISDAWPKKGLRGANRECVARTAAVAVRVSSCATLLGWYINPTVCATRGPRLFSISHPEGKPRWFSKSSPEVGGDSHAVDGQAAAVLLFLGGHAGIFVKTRP